MREQELLKKAEEASQYAYAPYSHFQVGAAVLCVDGSIYTGCNVENASYGLCMCAERVAIGKAVSEGKRRIDTIAIAGREEGGAFRASCSPCGACRQVIAEFSDENTRVITGNSDGEWKEWSVREMLPAAFEMEESNESL